MQSESDAKRGDASTPVRNPFGVMDVPAPNDDEVTQFAGSTALEQSVDDDNAKMWIASDGSRHETIEGKWSSRWNGGADPTIPGDAAHKWKQGRAEARMAGESICCSIGITARAKV